MKDKLVTFLDKILGPHKEFSGFEFYYECPLCFKKDGKKKLAIKLDPKSNSTFGSFHCWRDTSHKGKNLFQLLKKINADKSAFIELGNILGQNSVDLKDFDSYISEEFFNKNLPENNNKVNISLPNEFISFRENMNRINTPHYKNAYIYIKNRGITDEDIIKYNIGYCESGRYSGYIIIPSYDSNMNLNYFIARSFYGNEYKYKNPPIKKTDIIFNELFINWKEPIVICEGVFDSITIKRNSIPIMGKYISKKLKLKIIKEAVNDVYISLDSDAIKDSINIIEDFMKNGINVYFIDLPKKDPNEMGFNNFWKLLKKSKKLQFDDLIKLKIHVL